MSESNGKKRKSAYVGSLGDVNGGFNASPDTVDAHELDIKAGKKRKSEKDPPEIRLNDIPIGVNDTDDKENQDDCKLLYKISDRVPIHLTLLFAFQQALLSLSTSLAVSLLVAEVVCAEKDEDFKARLLSSTLFMNGVTTLLMNVVGVRLPLYQGATPDYVAPLLAMADLDTERCDVNTTSVFNSVTNQTEVLTTVSKEEIILSSVQGLQGALIAAGAIHFLIGTTGLVGVLLRFIGPVTIVPSILLLGIYIVKSITKFSQYHWGLAFMTSGIAIILSLYLAKKEMPIPVFTRRHKCHVIKYPLHQVFAILIALLIGWMVCGIMTEAGYFNTDPDSKDFYSRTDARSDVIKRANWFNFPYPGQFGPIGFSVTAFVGFVVATFLSILDSIGDYYACAAICQVPAPPSHAVNRGIAVEGFCSALSGAIGCGHATTTYGGNIGAIGLTRVGSRWVFVAVACIYLVFGLLGKISAVFITIPYPVLGGVLIVMFGMFNGVVLSNLKSVDLSSTRNLAIIGTSLLVGLMIPQWVSDYDDIINTGSSSADDIITMLLGNPNLVGSILACFLDNTIPGTREERGIAAWQPEDISKVTESGNYAEGYEVYDTPFYSSYKHARILRYLPFMPAQEIDTRTRSLSADMGRRRSLIGPEVLMTTR